MKVVNSYVCKPYTDISFINVQASLLEIRHPYLAVIYGDVSPDMLFAAFYNHYVASLGRIVLFADFFESVQGQDMLVCPCRIDAYGASALLQRTHNIPCTTGFGPWRGILGGKSCRSFHVKRVVRYQKRSAYV